MKGVGCREDSAPAWRGWLHSQGARFKLFRSRSVAPGMVPLLGHAMVQDMVQDMVQYMVQDMPFSAECSSNGGLVTLTLERFSNDLSRMSTRMPDPEP